MQRQAIEIACGMQVNTAAPVTEAAGTPVASKRGTRMSKLQQFKKQILIAKCQAAT